jgi:hypothetical protein
MPIISSGENYVAVTKQEYGRLYLNLFMSAYNPLFNNSNSRLLEPNNGRKKLRARNLRHKVLGYCVLKEL